MEIPLKFKINLDKQPLNELNNTLDISLKKFNEITKTFQQQVEKLKQIKDDLKELQETTQNINKEVVAGDISKNIAENIHDAVVKHLGDVNLPVKIDTDLNEKIVEKIGDVNLPVKIDTDLNEKIVERIGDINLPVKIDTDLTNSYRILEVFKKIVAMRQQQQPKEIQYIKAEEADYEVIDDNDLGEAFESQPDTSQQKKDLADTLTLLQQLKKNLGKDTTKGKTGGFSSKSSRYYGKDIPILDEIIEPFKSMYTIIRNVMDRFLAAGETVYNAFKSFKDGIRENIIEPYKKALEQFSDIASYQLGLLYDNISQKYLKETTQEEALSLGVATTVREGKLYRELTEEERQLYGVVSKKGGGERISPGKLNEIKLLAKTIGKSIGNIFESYKEKIISILIVAGTLLLFTLWNMFIVGKLLPWLRNSEFGKNLMIYLEGIFNATKTMAKAIGELVAWFKNEPTPQEKQEQDLIKAGISPEQAKKIAFPEYNERIIEGYKIDTNIFKGRSPDYEQIQQYIKQGISPTNQQGKIFVVNQDLDSYMRQKYYYMKEEAKLSNDVLVKNKKDIATIDPNQYEFILQNNDKMLNILSDINKNITDLNKNIRKSTIPESSVQSIPSSSPFNFTTFPFNPLPGK